jgi:nitrate/nitrite transport system ATP-binding protein
MTSAPREAIAPVLALRGVSKGFGSGPERRSVLAHVDFELGAGEFVAILGFSGSGKTTLLQVMAGLLAPDAGSVERDGVPAREPGPDRALIFQSYALLPWATALENVQLAVDAVLRGAGRAERRERALHFLRLVGLDAAAGRRPHELSGGMRQRVAVARALALEPRILLLDEPLSALDALTRASLQVEIARIWERDRTSAVLVTNDVDEALLLADRVLALTPRGCFGPAFPVALPRPRERAALNHDPAFRKLRNEITAYLVEQRDRSAVPHAARRAPPTLRPIALPPRHWSES